MPSPSLLQHRLNHINLQLTREQSEVKDLRGWGLGQRKVVAATGVCRNATQKIFTHTNGTKSYHHNACIKMCSSSQIYFLQTKTYTANSTST